MKRQVYKNGMIVAIPLDNNKYTYGIAIYDYTLSVYDCITNGIDTNINWDILKINREIFQLGCHKSVFSSNGLLLVKYDTLTSAESHSLLKPVFWQSTDDFKNCEIVYMDRRVPSRKATPEECIGLESGIAETEHVIERTKCYYQGKKYWSAEYTKVILSANDVRLKNNIRWDDEKEKWVLRD